MINIIVFNIFIMSAGVLVYLAGGTDDILSFAGVDFCKRES